MHLGCEHRETTRRDWLTPTNFPESDDENHRSWRGHGGEKQVLETISHRHRHHHHHRHRHRHRQHRHRHRHRQHHRHRHRHPVLSTASPPTASSLKA